MTTMPLQISTGLALPCGIKLENRLVKAAMAEGMSDSTHMPNHKFIQAYSQWAVGGWGLVITGNVQVDVKYLGENKDVSVSEAAEERSKTLAAWKSWSTACQKNGTPTIVQLNHPGRQSPIFAGTKSIFEKNIAPSPVPLDFGPSWFARAIRSLVFGSPREITVEDIQKLVDQFGDVAKLAAESGFKGVEIHAAHGYLLAQFLSPKSNIRTDEYGGSPAKRVRILIEIIRKIRSVTPSSFIIGIKLNSADHQSPTGLQECLEQIELVNAEKIDFLEISGGTYEDPKMMQAAPNMPSKKASTARREAFFLDFAQLIRVRFPTLLLVVTGGFRSRAAMEEAIASGACDLIGLARPAAAVPRLPKELILNSEIEDEEARVWLRPVELPWLMKRLPLRNLAAGAETAYYNKQIQRMGRGLSPILPP